ncbi:glycosyltransferase family 2 protein [Synechococcus elongatus]|uniref:glycosyltransferase n=1 Tax=Synechococcus elongatus TaxID=32046 RepID=UPI0030CC46D3
MPLNSASDVAVTPSPVALPSTPEMNYYQYTAGRRRKAAFVLIAVWGLTLALHLSAWGGVIVWAIAIALAIHCLRLLGTRSHTDPASLPADRADWPRVSLLVAAKNEAEVIDRLVNNLCQLDYPSDRLEVWIIDDASTDATPDRLRQLQSRYPQLRVHRREAGATGGKSGALNEVWPQTTGEFIAVFDADAQAPADLLQQVLPRFQQPQLGAVQVRKAIANSGSNFWTRGQTVEMMLDAYLQQQRVAIGGIGELRGNGQFIRRAALEGCGGFNEETITDDLDLAFRLHLDHWWIDCCIHPAVQEEGVVRSLALWHQRRRWAEGGYQRYLDYWPWLIRNRLGSQRSLDLAIFWLTQYVLPTATIPDLVFALILKRSPLYGPLAGLTVGLTVISLLRGIRQARSSELRNPWPIGQSLLGVIYMLHWVPVMAYTTARMAFWPKQLRWVKTVHVGETSSVPVA